MLKQKRTLVDSDARIKKLPKHENSSKYDALTSLRLALKEGEREIPGLKISVLKAVLSARNLDTVLLELAKISDAITKDTKDETIRLKKLRTLAVIRRHIIDLGYQGIENLKKKRYP